MPDLPISSDLENFEGPNRRPWLLLLIVLAACGFFLVRHLGKGAGTERPQPTDDAPPVGDVVAAAPVESGGAAPVAPPPGLQSLLRQAREMQARHPAQHDALDRARALYLEAWQRAPEGQVRRQIEDTLGPISLELALTPLPMAEKVEYIVRPGDSIARIAKRFGTTTLLIQKSNAITTPNLIKVGDRFQILDGDFSIDVSKHDKDLTVYLDGKFFCRYGVGTGKFGKTPVGTFEVFDRISEPVWWKPDGKEIPFGHPENILGTRWMAIRATGDTPKVRGYGIHGTWDNSSIGKAESAGCIRMRNTDVEQLFCLLPNGTPVTITD